MTRADDLVAAWRFYRLLRAWRDEALAGHVWVRVDLHPGHAPTVRPVRYVADACQGTEGGGVKRVNGGYRFGRTWIGFRRAVRGRYAPKRLTWRTGGHKTPGPWWELVIPRVGSFVVNRDRTLFGWDDPATPGGDR